MVRKADPTAEATSVMEDDSGVRGGRRSERRVRWSRRRMSWKVAPTVATAPRRKVRWRQLSYGSENDFEI